MQQMQTETDKANEVSGPPKHMTSRKSLQIQNIRSHSQLPSGAQSPLPNKNSTQLVTQTDLISPGVQPSYRAKNSNRQITGRSYGKSSNEDILNVVNQTNQVGHKRVINLKNEANIHSSQNHSSIDLTASRRSHTKLKVDMRAKAGQSPPFTNTHSRTNIGVTENPSKVSLAIKDNGSVQLTVLETDRTKREKIKQSRKIKKEKFSELRLKGSAIKDPNKTLEIDKQQTLHGDMSERQINGVIETIPTNRSFEGSDSQPKKVTITIRKSDDLSIQESALKQLAGMIEQSQRSGRKEDGLLLIAAQENEAQQPQPQQLVIQSPQQSPQNSIDQISAGPIESSDHTLTQSPSQEKKKPFFSKQAQYYMQRSANSLKKSMSPSPSNRTFYEASKNVTQ